MFINTHDELRKFRKRKTEIQRDKENAEQQRPKGKLIEIVAVRCFCLFLSTGPFLYFSFILSLSTAVKKKF